MFKVDKNGLMHHYSWSLLACLVSCCPKCHQYVGGVGYCEAWEVGMDPNWLAKLPSRTSKTWGYAYIYILLLLPGKMDGCFLHAMFSNGKGLDFSCVPRVMKHIVKKMHQSHRSSKNTTVSSMIWNFHYHRIGWWENLQETPIFDGNFTMVSCRFSRENQSIFIRVWNWKLGLQKPGPWSQAPRPPP